MNMCYQPGIIRNSLPDHFRTKNIFSQFKSLIQSQEWKGVSLFLLQVKFYCLMLIHSICLLNYNIMLLLLSAHLSVLLVYLVLAFYFLKPFIVQLLYICLKYKCMSMCLYTYSLMSYCCLSYEHVCHCLCFVCLLR